VGKERLQNPENAPRFVVYCNTYNFQYISEGTGMVEKASLEEIANRHAELNPTHEVCVGEMKLFI